MMHYGQCHHLDDSLASEDNVLTLIFLIYYEIKDFLSSVNFVSFVIGVKFKVIIKKGTLVT